MTEAAPMPLEGIRILDLSGWQTGAGGTVLLADLGADVIKIEEPSGGEGGRLMHITDKLPEGFNLFFELMNRNKRGIALDLKSAEGRDVFLRLVEHADVVAENFRVGTMERLGIGYETLKARKPNVILGSVNGFGPRGPDAAMGVFDIMGHSRSGLLYLLSDPSRLLRYVGGHGIADHNGAIFFAFAIMAALISRGLHGGGQHVSASQLGGLMTHQMLPINRYLFTGDQPWRGMPSQSSPLFTFYAAKDGKYLTLGCTPEWKYWTTVCAVVERPDLEHDPRFAEPAGRRDNADELSAILRDLFATRPRAEWLERLAAANVPSTPLQEYSDLANDPQALENEYIVEYDHPLVGRVREVGFPVNFSHDRPRLRRPAPGLGEHTEEVLSEFGFSSDEITALAQKGVIRT